MGLLVDKLDGIEPVEVVELIAREVDENRERIEALERGVLVSDEALLLTSLCGEVRELRRLVLDLAAALR